MINNNATLFMRKAKSTTNSNNLFEYAFTMKITKTFIKLRLTRINCILSLKFISSDNKISFYNNFQLNSTKA